MLERARNVSRGPGRQLLESAVGEPGEIVDGPLERSECRPPRLVRDRDRNLRTTGERLEKPPLRGGQVFEAVRKDGLAVPRVQLAGDSLDGGATQTTSIPETKSVDLFLIGL